MDKNFLMPKTSVIFKDHSEKEISNEHTLAGYLPNIRGVTDICVDAQTVFEKLGDNTVEFSVSLDYTLLYVSSAGDYKRTHFSTTENFSLPAPDIAKKAGENYTIEVEPCVFGVTHKLLSERSILTKARLQLTTRVKKSATVFLYPRTDCENVEYRYCELLACRETAESAVELDLSDEVKLSKDMPQISEILSEKVIMCLDTVMRDGSLYAVGNANYSCVYLPSAADSGEGKEFICVEKAINVECDLGIAKDAMISISSLSVDSNVASDGYGDEKVISLKITAKLCPTVFENEECSYCADGYSPEYESECGVGSFECLTFDKLTKEKPKYETVIRSDGKSAVSVVQSYAEVFSPYAEISDGRVLVCARLCMSALCENTDGELCVVGSFENVRLETARSVADTNFSFIPSLAVCSADAHIENGLLKFEVGFDLVLASFVKRTVTAVTTLNVDENTKRPCADGEFIIYYPKKDDTVWSVAKHFGTTPECVMKNNGISDGSLSGKRFVVIG